MSDPAGAPNLALRTRAVTGVVRSADSHVMVVASGHTTRRVAILPSTVFRLLTSVSRAAVGTGDCVAIDRVTGRRAPARRTVTASTVIVAPAATCRTATPSPAPSGGLGTATPDLVGALGGGGLTRGLLGLADTNAGVVTKVTSSALLVAVGSGRATSRVITGRFTSYLAIRSGGPGSVTPGHCVTVFAQLPSTTLEAVTVTLTPSPPGRCGVTVDGFALRRPPLAR